MAPPIACVWWPHALPSAQQQLAAWLRHFSPYVEAAQEPGLFFIDATGFDGLFSCQTRWAQALYAACVTNVPLPASHALPVYVHLGHHKVALWALVRAQEQYKQATSRHLHQWSSLEVERAAAQQLPLDILSLPEATLAAAYRLQLYRIHDAAALPQPSVAQHVGAPLAAWLRSLFAPSAPLSRAVPLPPAIVHHDLEWPTDDHVRLMFACRSLVSQLMTQAQARRQHVESLHIACRYEGRTPPPPLVRRLELPEPGRDAGPWEAALRLMLEHTPWDARVCQVSLRAQMVWPKRPEQLILWPDRPHHEREATLEALAKIRSAWGSHAVTIAEMRASHLPEERFFWRAWQGQPLPAPAPQAARQQDPDKAGRLPRVRIVWPTPRPVPSKVLSVLRGDPQTQQAWWRGPYRINVGWWRSAPCDRDYVYIGLKDDAPMLIYFDRQQRRWWWQGQID